MEFRSLHTIDSSDNIRFRVELAGLASRVFAYLVDGLMMLTLMGLVLIIFSLPAIQALPDVSKTATPISMFLITFAYHLLQEWLWNGKTVGKALFGIRVVRNNGQPIGFWESLGRNLLRVLDVYMLGIGLLVMLCNRDEKRLGDFLVGTLVINNQAVSRPATTTPEGQPQPSQLQNGEPAVIINLSAEETELLKSFLARRASLLKEPRQQLATALCRYFSERLHRPLETETALEELLIQAQHSPPVHQST